MQKSRCVRLVVRSLGVTLIVRNAIFVFEKRCGFKAGLTGRGLYSQTYIKFILNIYNHIKSIFNIFNYIKSILNNLNYFKSILNNFRYCRATQILYCHEL